MINNDISTALLSRLEEDQLVAAVKRDPQAFVALYDRYLTPVYRYLVSRVGDRQDAEDLTSQVFLTALERFSQFRQQKGSFAAWLFTIARNKSIDFFRRRRPELDLTDEAPGLYPCEDPQAQAAGQDEAQVILDLIACFPADDREVLHLRFAAEMTYGEIAAMLHRNEGAVKKQVYRLLERIQKILEADHE